MKKFFKFLGILLLILIVVIVVVGLIAPKDIKVERSQTINAPKEVVFEQIVKFKNWPNWSPWYKMEPTVEISYQGIDGQPGSSYIWKGKKTGSGEMKNAGVNGTAMNYELHFKEPFENKAGGALVVTDTGNGQSKVTWSYEGHMAFPWNAMGVFMNMDKMLGGDFESGLNNMKAYIESNLTALNQAVSGNVDIKMTQIPAATYAVIRKTIAFSEMDKFFSEAYGTISKEAGQRIVGNPMALYYSWDDKNMKTDVAAGFPVSGNEAIKGATMISIPPQTSAYMAVHKGGYSGSMAVHEALAKHLETNGKKQSLVLEDYVVGPGTEQDSAKWVTNIYYTIQ